MKKTKLKNTIKKLFNTLKILLIYGFLGVLALIFIFWIFINAILQTSYKNAPVKPEEIMEVEIYDI